MDEINEINWEECEYCEQSYFEWDTGYAEYNCNLVDDSCMGGDIDYGCPLAFRYRIER